MNGRRAADAFSLAAALRAARCCSSRMRCSSRHAAVSACFRASSSRHHASCSASNAAASASRAFEPIGDGATAGEAGEPV